MKQEFVTLPRDAVERALNALSLALSDVDWRQDSPAQPVIHRAYNATRAALEQPQNHVPDAGNMVPAGWKLVPVEPTEEMLRAGCGSESPAMFRESLTDKQIDAIAESMPGGLDGFLKGWGWRQFARAVLEAAPQPPTVKECLTDELKPRFSAHDDAERLKSVARGMSYNDHGEAVWKHTLMEIAVRLESGGYAAPQPPALEQQVEKESTCKDSLQVEQAAVAWLATYTGKVGEPLVYVTSSYELAVENDRNQIPKPLHLHQQNLNCKSNQKRLATLWGYVKAEQPQVQQEPSPVAKIIGMDEEYGPMLLWHRAWADFPVGTKIYTHPQPKREPLTREKIMAIQHELSDTVGCSYETMARAIEAAHNIK